MIFVLIFFYTHNTTYSKHITVAKAVTYVDENVPNSQ